MAADKEEAKRDKSLKGMTDMLMKDSDKKTGIEQSAAKKRAKGITDSIASWADSNNKSLEKVMFNNDANWKGSSDDIVKNLNNLMLRQGKSQGEIFDEMAGMHISLADGFAKQYDFDAKKWASEKERLAEADRKSGEDLGVDAVDRSFDFDLGVIPVVAGIAGLVTGFIEGFFGPMGTLWKAMKSGADKFFKAIKWSLTPVGKVYTSIKSWFNTKITLGWTKFSDMVKNSKVGGWYRSVKAWFQGGLGKGSILTKISTLWKNSELGKDIAKIGNLFKGGGIKAPTWLTTIKDAFGKGGSFSWLRTIGRILGKIFFFAQIIMGVFDFWTGFEATEGNLFEKIVGGLKAAVKGFFGGFLDLGIMIEDGFKWIITKVAGFFGFDETAIAATMADFSLFGPLKDGLFAVVDWLGQMLTDPLAGFETLFGAYATIGKWIYDIALKPAWDWFEGMFPDAAAAIKPFFVGIANIGTWIYTKALKPFWDWIKLLFSDPMAAMTEIVTVMTGFGTYLWDSAIKPVWDWIKSIWAWGADDEGKSGDWSLATFIDTAWTNVKEWFTGIFSWASTEDEKDSWIIKTVKDAVTLAKKWLAGLFGFDEASKKIANAGEFSLGDILFSAIDSIWEWFKGLLDIDVMSIAKGIPGAETLLDWMSGETDKKEAEATKSLGHLMTLDKGFTEDDQKVDIQGLKAMTKGMSLTGMQQMMNQLETINDMDTMGDEISNWKNVEKMMMAQMKIASQAQGTVVIQDNSNKINQHEKKVVVPGSAIKINPDTPLPSES